MIPQGHDAIAQLIHPEQVRPNTITLGLTVLVPLVS